MTVSYQPASFQPAQMSPTGQSGTASAPQQQQGSFAGSGVTFTEIQPQVNNQQLEGASVPPQPSAGKTPKAPVSQAPGQSYVQPQSAKGQPAQPQAQQSDTDPATSPADNKKGSSFLGFNFNGFLQNSPSAKPGPQGQTQQQGETQQTRDQQPQAAKGKQPQPAKGQQPQAAKGKQPQAAKGQAPIQQQRQQPLHAESQETIQQQHQQPLNAQSPITIQSQQSLEQGNTPVTLHQLLPTLQQSAQHPVTPSSVHHSTTLQYSQPPTGPDSQPLHESAPQPLQQNYTFAAPASSFQHSALTTRGGFKGLRSDMRELLESNERLMRQDGSALQEEMVRRTKDQLKTISPLEAKMRNFVEQAELSASRLPTGD